MVSPEAWGAARLSKHHYAKTLAEAGSRVFFLGPALHGNKQVKTYPLEGITVVEAPSMLPGLRFLPSKLAARSEERYLERIAKACGGAFDVLWNFDLYRFRWNRSRTFAALRILHVMDLPVPAHLKAPASVADLVICVSKAMIQHLPSSATKVLHVPHGIYLPRGSEDTKRTELSGSGVKACYLGNLAIRYLDLNSLLSIASENPAVTLYLIGPVGGGLGGSRTVDPMVWHELIALPNVVHLGEVPSYEVRSWLAAMDILLIAYDSGRYPTETAHPHKLLEYLYSGKAILSSHLRDSVHLKHLFEMMPPKVPISAGFSRILSDLDELNAPEIQLARKEYARGMTYEQHITTIGEYLVSQGLVQ